jgi:sugar phosphate isomerase/epimerase
MSDVLLWNPTYSVAVSAWAPPAAPVILRGHYLNVLERAAGIGFTGVELHFKDAQEVDWKAVSSFLQAHDMKLSSVATGRIFTMDNLSLSHKDDSVVGAAITRISGIMDKVERYGSQIIIGVVRGKLSACGEQDRPRAYDTLVASLKKIATLADRAGLRVVVESINRADIDNVNDATELLSLLDDVGAKNVLGHLDTYHMLIEGEDMVAAIKAAKGRIGYFHLSDTDRKAPGQGSIDFKPVLRALYDSGYKNELAFECTPGPDACYSKVEANASDQDSCARIGLEYIKGCLAELNVR